LQLVLYNACSIPIILFIGAVSDLFGVPRVLYLLSACELAFGVWSIYYYRNHSWPPSTDEEVNVQNQQEANALDSSPSPMH
jgi:hypothetical protein